jgi:SprT-like family protein
MSEQPTLFPIDDDEGRQLQDLYDALAEKFGLHPACVRISRRKLTGGHIIYGPPHTIVISAHLSQKDRIETLRHEAAHAFCFKISGPDEAHSAKFWRVARSFGARRRHAPETEALEQFRQQRQIVYRCQTCRGVFPRVQPYRRAMLCAACHRRGKPARLIRDRRT